MKRIAWVLVPIFCLSGLSAAEEIPFNQLPVPIQATLLPHLQSARVETIRMAISGNERIYTIGLLQEQTWTEFQIRETGSIVSQTTRHIADANVPRIPAAQRIQSVTELPLVVQRTLWKEGWLATGPDFEHTRLVFFDINLVKDGKAIPVRITEDGALLKRRLEELQPIEPPLENVIQIPWNSLPHTVRESISKQRALGNPHRILKGDRGGETFYEAAFRGADRDRLVRLSEAGELVRLREGPMKPPEEGRLIQFVQLPLIVRAAVEQRYPSAAVESIRGRNATVYHFTVVNEDGKEIPVQILEDGALVIIAEGE